jgi:hypothetical protein
MAHKQSSYFLDEMLVARDKVTRASRCTFNPPHDTLTFAAPGT